MYIRGYLVAEFVCPPPPPPKKKVYNFNSIGDDRIPKSEKCTHSATEVI